jgi:predicted CXXCH cytochrome family protein
MKTGTKFVLAAVAALLVATPALALHDGGVAQCEACHTMHNSLEGMTMPYYGGTLFEAPSYLLQGGGTQSDACLVCHSTSTSSGLGGFGVSTSTVFPGETVNLPQQLAPGGDFSWLKVATFGVTSQELAGRRGHNVMATNNGYVADNKFATLSPGGDYPAASLHCSSCHDPHGKYRYIDETAAAVTTGAPIVGSGSYGGTSYVAPTATKARGVYRILGGAGYKPKSIAGPAFGDSTQPPVALAPRIFNRSEAATDTRVAYGSGMSEWCANCHGELLENAYVSGEAGHTHPAGNTALLGADIAANYNNYVSSGITTGTVGVVGYSSLVPFEEGTGVAKSVLAGHAVNDGTQTGGPSATSNVSCLSCHRAHAGAFKSMLRYDPTTLMTTDTGTYSSFADVNAATVKAYYGRPATKFGNFQRALCNKCHAKD